MTRITRPVRIHGGVVHGLSPHDSIPWVYDDPLSPVDHAERIVARLLKEVDDEDGSVT